MIQRDLAPKLLAAAELFPAVTLTGPRQSGKSTLCRGLFPNHPYVNLEAPDERGFALSDPRGFLAQFPDGAVIDEVQRAPEITSYLQEIIDRDPRPGRWILTGSQNFALHESVSQSLAGRTAILHLLPLCWNELTRFDNPPKTLDEAILSGGYPRIFDKGLKPADWLSSYVATYVERDVRSLSNIGDLQAFQRFIELCAGRTGQLLNYSSLANDCGVTQPTAKFWIGLLEASFIAFRLRPFHTNLRKRLTKMPKLHFYDSGLACWLLNIQTTEQLRSHPLRGLLFESWVASEILKHRTNLGERPNLSFYRTRSGLESDLLLERPKGITLIEVKASQTPSQSMFKAIGLVAEHLEHEPGILDSMVVYGGDKEQKRTAGQIIPWSKVCKQTWTSE
ncbi:MAG: ATP-binding protein [Planctomycetes bacterium]|nr:ATP-binding protein [Planctomycetota bacterium]